MTNQLLSQPGVQITLLSRLIQGVSMREVACWLINMSYSAVGGEHTAFYKKIKNTPLLLAFIQDNGQSYTGMDRVVVLMLIGHYTFAV